MRRSSDIPQGQPFGAPRGRSRTRAGAGPEDWIETKREPNEVDARWTKKNGSASLAFRPSAPPRGPSRLASRPRVSPKTRVRDQSPPGTGDPVAIRVEGDGREPVAIGGPASLKLGLDEDRGGRVATFPRQRDAIEPKAGLLRLVVKQAIGRGTRGAQPGELGAFLEEAVEERVGVHLPGDVRSQGRERIRIEPGPLGHRAGPDLKLAEHVDVDATAVGDFDALESRTERQLRYADFIDIHGALDDNEREHCESENPSRACLKQLGQLGGGRPARQTGQGSAPLSQSVPLVSKWFPSHHAP